MLYSQKLKFIFVHIQRTGGTSIGNILNRRKYGTVSLNNQHENARTAEGLALLNRFPTYYKMGFVRNPWERIFSWYALTTGKAQSWSKEEMKDFEAYLKPYFEYCKAPKSGAFFHFNQLDYITDTKGDLLVNNIGRMESFEQDLGKMLTLLGISCTKIPRVNKTQGLSYTDFYSARAKAFVQEKCAKDIEYFAYRF